MLRISPQREDRLELEDPVEDQEAGILLLISGPTGLLQQQQRPGVQLLPRLTSLLAAVETTLAVGLEEEDEATDEETHGHRVGPEATVPPTGEQEVEEESVAAGEGSIAEEEDATNREGEMLYVSSRHCMVRRRH